ncbi:MAG: cytidylate kinase family protein [Candidatus Komeilibacteria bacterium]|nr:cytidylate kinase family protein [Candidatus Komeilibacteria bacterium]
MKKYLPSLITISGLPGSGKSTLAKLLAKKYHYHYLYGGGLFRPKAKKKGLSIEEFDRPTPQILKDDLIADQKLINYVKHHKKVIYEAHLAGWMTYLHKIPAFKVFIKISKKERVNRYSEREHVSLAQALKFINTREKSLRSRYKKNYHLDYLSTKPYDYLADGRPLPAVIVKNIDTYLKKQKELPTSRPCRLSGSRLLP